MSYQARPRSWCRWFEISTLKLIDSWFQCWRCFKRITSYSRWATVLKTGRWWRATERPFFCSIAKPRPQRPLWTTRQKLRTRKTRNWNQILIRNHAYAERNWTITQWNLRLERVNSVTKLKWRSFTAVCYTTWKY